MSTEPFLAIADDADSTPLLAETRALFDAVNALDLGRLRALVDDDCGIVDIDPAGGSIVIDSPGEWEGYMRRDMAAAGGRLSTEILEYTERPARRSPTRWSASAKESRWER